MTCQLTTSYFNHVRLSSHPLQAMFSENAPLERYLAAVKDAPPADEVVGWVDKTLKENPIVMFT